ncbi:hypothetical protein [Wolbachia endosymbiont of Aedes albopictus]|uniref:hypothetical protein n=1 Tax=Wolbachia endosymbiont of Aedes albopictus TaxID=167957 RepID=UPI00216909C1|nr:hypothetical protein [Wolbachia endosymbiont of Aedes albopictus]UVW84395.1 hypothetical protein NHG98_02740 [Wolbachia endosymbiont of Aedes albopictus]
MKETFCSEKEKITCKGAMEVAGTQPYERCNIAQYCTVNYVIPVPSFLSSQCLFSLSSQCVTLGSILFSSWTLYALRICYPFPSFLSSQCVTLGSTLFSSWTLYAPRICYPFPFFLSSQCVTLGSTLFSSWTLYAPRICCSLHNLQIFLYLDPSVTHWDDRKKGYWDDTFQVSQITMFVQLYVKCWNDIE